MKKPLHRHLIQFVGFIRLRRMELLYKLHLRLRRVHDVSYLKSPIYKKVSDSPYTRPARNAVVAAFLLSFILFTALPLVTPFFNLGKPAKVYAGSNSKTWTTNGDFAYNKTAGCEATIQSQVAISGNAYTDATCAAAASDATVTSAQSAISFAPASVAAGGALTYDGSGNIYALSGNLTTGFYKYTVSSNSWSAMAAAPATINSGGALTYDGAGNIYALRGNNTTSFYKYTIASNTWSTMAAITGSVSSGGALTYDGAGNIYAFSGNLTTGFYKYIIDSDAWFTMAVAPAAIYYGGSLVSDGADSIYAFSGYANTSFYKYIISTNTWSTMAVAPAAISHGSSLVYDGAGNIYAFSGNSTTGFYKYTISANTWSAMAVAPAAVHVGGALAYDGSGNIYALRGNSTSAFYKYTISTNNWNAMKPTIAGIHSGGALVYDGSGNIYALRGNSMTGFYKYIVATNTWSPMAVVPSIVYGGGALAYDGAATIYAFAGNNTTSFYKYFKSSNMWSATTAAPAAIGTGGSLVYDGAGNIYAFSGNGTTGFYKFTISTNTWSNMAVAPASVGAGGSLSYDGAGNIYGLTGNGGTGFYKYTISTNTWSTMAPAQAAGYSGGALTYDGSGNFYAQSGNSTGFYKYTVSSNTWSTMSAAPALVFAGGALTSDGAGNIYGLSGNDTTDFYKYSTSLNSWNQNLYKYQSPGVISNLRVNAGSGQKVRWGTISWNSASLPSNTSISFKARTSDNGTNWSAWSGDFTQGTAGTTTGTGALSTLSSSQYLDITLTQTSSDGVSTPTLNDFTVSYDALETPINDNVIIKKADGSSLKDSSGNNVSAGSAGGWTNESAAKVVVTGLTCTSCGVFTNPYVEIEYKPVGIGFDGTANIAAGSVDGGNQSTVTLTGLSTGTSYHMQMRTKDAQGRVSGWTSYGNNAENVADFSVDQAAPTGSILINDGSSYTASASVNLTISGSDTGGSNFSQMRLSNDGSAWSAWENYSTTKTWTLANGDGEKNVYLQFIDNAGNIGGVQLTENLSPVSDTYIYSYSPNTNYGSSTDLQVRADTASTSDSDYRQRGLLRFDLSTLSGTKFINSAELSVYARLNTGGGGVGRTHRVYRLTETDWSETGATWNSKDGLVSWTSAGGAYDNSLSASSIISAIPSWQKWDLKSIVEADLGDTGTNLDIIVMDSNEAAAAEQITYNSRTETANQPSLVVNYTIPYSDTINLDTQPPAQPANLQSFSVADPATRATLDANTWYDYSTPYFGWNGNTESDIAGYKYCFGSSNCSNLTSVGAGTMGVTVDVSSVGSYPDGIYYFNLFSYDLAGNQSISSAQIAYKLDRNVPGAVTGYTTMPLYDDHIHISWTSVPVGGGSSIAYQLERIAYNDYYDYGYSKEDVGEKVWSSLGSYRKYENIIDTYKDESVTAGDIVAGTKYVYRIRAFDETGKHSPYQNDLFYGLTRDGVDPLPPSNVVTQACSYQNPDYCLDGSHNVSTDNLLKGHQVTIRWSPGSDTGTGIVAYEIYRTTSVATIESNYELIDTVSVTNPLPAMDQYSSLVYVDNGRDDYTTYHYRVVSVDGAADETYPANKSRIVKNLTDFTNYASGATPDVTAPTAPVVSAAAGGLDSTNEKQKIIITWSGSTDSGAGVKTYQVYKAVRADSTDQSGSLIDSEFADVTVSADISCDLIAKECVDEGLEDYKWYYYRIKAVDNDPYNNVSEFSQSAYTKTLSSAVPSPVRGRKNPQTQVYEQFPYVESTKGSPVDNAAVGDEVKVTFTGSYEKDCVVGPNVPCLVRYETYRSLDKQNWTKFGNDITPTRIDNDTDNQYMVVDSGLSSATKYYYRIKAVGNNPDVSGGGESYSGIGNTANQGWDITPDSEAPALPVDLKVKDIHDDGANYKRNIVTWARIDEPQRNGVNDFREYRIYRSTDGILWNQICSDGINTIYLDGGCTTQYPNPLYDSNKEIALATNYIMDLIPIGQASQDYYYYVTSVDDAGDTFKYPNGDVVNSFSNESKPNVTSSGQVVSVNINPAIAQPTITTQGANSPKVYDIGVSTATLRWYADQLTDSVVEFKSTSDSKWVTIGDRVPKYYNEPHVVQLFGLAPKTTYEYKIISRNGLGNEDVVGDKDSEKQYLPALTTNEFNIDSSSVKFTTTTTGASFEFSTNLDAQNVFVEYQMQKQSGDDSIGGSASPSPEAIIASPRNHKVVVGGLKSSRPYSFKIKAISKDNYVTQYPDSQNNNAFGTFNTKNFDTSQFAIAPSSSNVAERNITATTAQIVWQTTVSATSWVDYSTTSGKYDNSSGDNQLTLTHVVKIDGLVPGTKYFYRVRSKDSNDIEYTSQEYSFVAILKPKISNMRVKDVTPYTVIVAWDTNVETETIINWGQTSSYGEKRGVSGLSKVHEIKVDNLLDNTEYHYQILAKDETGNEVADEDKIIRTPLDKEGPKIVNAKTDILPMGENDVTASVIISWQTNKPASTQVVYDEGIIGGNYGNQSTEDTSLNTSHTVIIKELKPASSYHYRMVSMDKRSNRTESQDFTFVTPTKEKSILQLIIKSLEDTFSWTRNLNQFFGNIGKRITGRK